MENLDARVATLALPSLVVLVLLVIHSFRSLPRWRALFFWVAVLVYGVVRGVGVLFITRTIGARFPYEIHRPLFAVFGVSLQEISGWAIVAYLAWWLGHEMARRYAGGALYVQAAWGCLFLGCVSWTVEAAAVASGWWHWTVPTASRLFLNVPTIGLIDWFFVGTDFVVPFLALTAPQMRGRPARFLTLLLYPLHFGSHAFIEPVAPFIPIPVFHLVHWLLLALIVALATRSDVRDEAFREPPGAARFFPTIGAAIIVLDAIAVLLFVARKPILIAATLPMIALVIASLTRRGGAILPVTAGVAALAKASFVVSAVPHLTRAALLWLRQHRRALTVVLLAMGALAWTSHQRSITRRAELKERLKSALAWRDQNNLTQAVSDLRKITEDYPTEHTPMALLGEIYYRTDRLSEAAPLYARTVEIKGDFLPGFRHSAVIALRQGDRARAADFVSRGLAVEPEDLELRYLERRTRGEEIDPLLPEVSATARKSQEIAALAFEVDDHASARKALDAAIARHPGVRALYPMRVRIALAARDNDDARRVVEKWMERFPNDEEPRVLAWRLR